GLTTTLTYDTRMRLTSRNVGGELTVYGLDFVGQLTLLTLPDGSFIAYGYDGAHRLQDIQDSANDAMHYTLDAMGNRTQEATYDQLSVLAQTRSRVYNNLNRLTQEIGAQNQTTQYGYDNQGNVKTVTDPLNHSTTNQYDALNRLFSAADPNSGITQYGFD